MGKIVSVYEHFGLRTTFRNELSSWTEVWLYIKSVGWQHPHVISTYKHNCDIITGQGWCTSLGAQIQVPGTPDHKISYGGAEYIKQNYCKFSSLTYKNVYRLTCTGQVQMSLRNSGSSVRNWYNATSMAPRFWRWILDFGPACTVL